MLRYQKWTFFRDQQCLFCRFKRKHFPFVKTKKATQINHRFNGFGTVSVKMFINLFIIIWVILGWKLRIHIHKYNRFIRKVIVATVIIKIFWFRTLSFLNHRRKFLTWLTIEFDVCGLILSVNSTSFSLSTYYKTLVLVQISFLG